MNKILEWMKLIDRFGFYACDSIITAFRISVKSVSMFLERRWKWSLIEHKELTRALLGNE